MSSTEPTVSGGGCREAPRLPSGVLFDFTGTLFHIESAAAALTAALGPGFAHWAPQLERFGAINGSGTSPELPAQLADVWARRDLDAAAHRAAYSGLSRHAGLSAQQAHEVYQRGIDVAAWSPYPDTAQALTRLHQRGTRTALVSNIGWDPRPVLLAHGVADLLDVLVLSDERAVEKPDPAIFALACAEICLAPADVLMVGDNASTDGAATAIGCQFALVDPSPTRPADTLLRAVGFIG